ncbi:MAG: LamB/YcsF family protein [Gammaproteobacteria bacterium]|nr:LamB/YcsF family protein [Gammaproteobacteria bacterium]
MESIEVVFPAMATIDLNADLGEGAPFDAELLQIVSSANIACGGHAGDSESMAATVRSAIANGVAVGAHPGYADRDGFGRESGFMSGDALYESLTGQVTALADIAAELGARLSHVKPHGALYNDALRNRDLADIIARVIAEAPGEPAFMGMAGTELERSANQHGLDFVAEAFVDRAYEPDGTLVSRKEPGAVHEDLAVATTQAVRLAEDGETTARNGEIVKVRADTLCIHGDTPGAAEKARAVRDVLESHGVDIRAHTQR